MPFRSVIAHLLAAAASVLIQAQAADLEDHNAHVWLSYIGDHPVAGSPWGAHLEAQVRRSELGDGWQQLLIRPGVNYALNERVAFSAGYCFVETHRYGDYPALDDFPEHRIWEQVTVSVPWLGLTWANRFRLEQRYIGELRPVPTGGLAVGNYRYENRFRYLLRTTVPLGASGNYYLVAWDEVFINFGSEVKGNTFDQNRAFVGLGRKLGKHFKVEAGFMEQTIQRRLGRIWEHNHTLAIYLASNAPFGSAAPESLPENSK